MAGSQLRDADVRAISLSNTVFEGENTVYLLGADGDGPLTLVDAGFDDPDIRTQLVDGLADVGATVSDVDQVLLTHYHGDHAGLAGWIQSEGGATVRIHAEDAPLAAPDEETLRDLRAQQEARFAAWGMPEAKRAEVHEALKVETDLTGEPLDVDPIADGETVRAGGATLHAHLLPGHTAGHVAYASVDDRTLFAGDAILPKYTPNVGGADIRLDDALAVYLDSLERVIGLAPETAWPGHRGRIDEPVERARVIVDHHRERTANVLDVLRERGPLDTWSVSHELFGELSDIHILHGPGEAHAHLEHLESHGVVASDEGVYSLRVDDPDLNRFFPAV